MADWHDDIFYDKLSWNWGAGQYLGADEEEDEDYEDDEEDEG